jgi:hypothetical protein
MRQRTRWFIVSALCVGWSVPTFACPLWFSSSYLAIPSAPTIGAGISFWPEDPATTVIGGDVAFKLGDKFVLRPGVGVCMEDSENNMIFGAMAAYNAFQEATGKIGVNFQAGFETISYDGASWRNIPIGVAIQMKNSETMSLFGGAAFNMTEYSYDDFGGSFEETSSDPSVYGGAVFATGKMKLMASATLWMGDETDFGLNVGATMAVGGGSSALRRLNSLFRR